MTELLTKYRNCQIPMNYLLSDHIMLNFKLKFSIGQWYLRKENSNELVFQLYYKIKNILI